MANAKGIHVDGIEEALERFDRIDTSLRSPDVKRIFQVAGDMVAERARSMAPVRSGLLASTIFARAYVRDTIPQVIVGARARYAVPVEYGTEDTPAQPFLRPAADELHDALVTHVGTAIEALLKR